jgi:hypothetical protein
MTDNTNTENGADFLGDGPEPEQRAPNINIILADNLKADDLVMIDSELMQFVAKEDHDGPHVFWAGDRKAPVRLFTTDICEKILDFTYIRPSGSKSPFITGKLDDLSEEAKERIRILFGAINPEPRKRGQAKWLYVSHFLTKISQAKSDGWRFSRNPENAALVTYEVDKMIDEFNKDKPAHKRLEKSRTS